MKTIHAGTLLRQARRGAGLSQTELAKRAHLAQSVISAYESGRREPAVRTLARLVAATGYHLAVHVEPATSAPPELPETRLGQRLRMHRDAVLSIATRHKASNVRVFGSVARGEDESASDIDLLVDLEPDTGLFGLGSLRRELADLLDTAVDVTPADSLKPPLRDEVEHEAIPL